jgi:hypothetical protein
MEQKAEMRIFGLLTAPIRNGYSRQSCYRWYSMISGGILPVEIPSMIEIEW